jgi:hypothetical protein
MKSKVLIGIICFVLGGLAGHFGPGIVKAEIDAHKADSEQEAPVDETLDEVKEDLAELKETAAKKMDEVKKEVKEEVKETE